MQKPKKHGEKLKKKFLPQTWWEMSDIWGHGVPKPVQKCISKDPDLPPVLCTFSNACKYRTVYVILD